MKKTTYFLLAMTVLVTLFASACGVSVAPATQAAPPPPVQVVPTIAPVVIVPSATAQQPAPTVQAFAPACQIAACPAPAVEEMDTEVMKTYCVKKVPYQNILVAPGTRFESLDTSGEFKCQDSGTVENGKAVIACTGKDLWTYELKLINPACSASALTTGTGQCQEGLGYDAAQNCCAPLTGGDAGSVTIKVNIGSCE